MVSLDNKGFGGAMLMDLSKAFEIINHDHLIAKFHAYGFSNDNLFDIDQKLNINLVHGKS